MHPGAVRRDAKSPEVNDCEVIIYDRSLTVVWSVGSERTVPVNNTEQAAFECCF
jgi:hypothetical protein